MKKTRLELCIIILIACSMLSLAQQICYGASGWCCEEGRCACQYPEGCYGSDGNIYGSISEFEADLNKPSPGYGQTTPAPKECYEISGWCCEGGACTCQHSGGCYGKNGNIYGSISESEADLTSLPPGYGQITPASGEGKEAGVSGGTAEEISGKCTKEQCKQIDKVWLRIGQALGISKANEKQVWDEGWFISDDVYGVDSSQTAVSGEGIVGVAIREWELWGKGTKTESGMQNVVKNYFEKSYCPYRTYTDPWSAAFITYVAREANVYFPRRCSHFAYFTEIRDDASRYSCKTYPMSQKNNIKVGDIVCYCRDNSCPIRYNDAYAEQKSHCDIVVSKEGGTIKAIGGNLDSSVRKITINVNDPKYFGFISC